MIEPTPETTQVHDSTTVGANSILLVDDTFVLRERLSTAMEQRGFRVETAGNLR